jgi:tRNA(fMet)-specific endonuclease VapC
MAEYLLDTNICIFYLRGKYDVDKKIKEAGGLAHCVISEITIAELKYGAELSERTEENRRLVDDFSQAITILPIFNSLAIFAKEKARLKRSGNLIDDFDLLIGCSAVVNQMILVTENEKHFTRIENITIENWIIRR